MRKFLFAAALCLVAGAARAAGAEAFSPMAAVAERFELALIVTYALSAVWAVAVLATEALKRRALRPIDVAANAEARRKAGLPEAMTEAERRAAEARCAVLEAAERDGDGLFLHQADVYFACEALAACRKDLPTDPALAGRLNALSECAGMGLRRVCMLWHAGCVGKGLVIGGLVAAGIASAYAPQFAVAILVPMALFLLFSLTPTAVALNPNPVDALMTKTFGACCALCGIAGAIGESTETVYVDRWTKEVVARETNPFAFVMYALGLCLLVISVFFLFVRVEILFLRNFLVYR